MSSSGDLDALYLRLERLLRHREQGVLALGGIGRKCGCTTITLQLAQRFASGGARTLVIEGNLAHPAMLQHCRLPAPDDDLFAVLDSQANLNQGLVTWATTGANVAILASPAASDKLVHRNQWEPLLKEARDQADIVLVDCGRLDSPGGRSLAGLCDAVVPVTVAGRTTLPSLRSCLETFDHHTERLLGAVLNRRRFPIPRFLYRLL